MAKGMILAAGQGTRVRPLTNDLPKAMVPILGKPVMEYLIEHLARYGVNEIMVNVAWHHDKIEQYFGDGHRWGVQIGYSYEGVRDHGDILPKPMGSAGGMRRIQDFGGFFDTTTIVLCGDALIDLDIGAALHEHKSKGAIASVVTLDVPLAEVKNYGIVVAEPDGRIQSFQEKPDPADAKSTLASTGIYIFEPEVLERIPSGKVYDIGSQLFPQLVAEKLPFYAQSRFFNWIDIGRVSDYWSVLQRVLRGEVAQLTCPGARSARVCGSAQHLDRLGRGDHPGAGVHRLQRAHRAGRAHRRPGLDRPRQHLAQRRDGDAQHPVRIHPHRRRHAL
jgi:mannose-1-phosphate guanylyltransferase